ncbi:unnamed protein product [Calypogeia fissa]
MKRVRDIDLEAPVCEDDDGEDERDGEDSYASAWDEKYFKKARWLQPDISQRDPKAGKWPRDPANRHDINTSPPPNDGIVEFQAPHSGIKQSQEHEEGTRAAKWGTEASLDLHISMHSDFPESRPEVENEMPHGLETFPNAVESERQSVGKGSHGIEESAQGEEQTAGKDSVLVDKEKRTFPSPPAVLLYSVDDRQDGELHSTFEKHGALLSQADVSVCLEAVSVIGQHVELIKESRTRKFVTEIIQQELWKVEEPSVIQALVKVLCSVATTSCEDDGGEGKSLDWASYVAHFLSQYITTKDLRGSPLKSGLKLHLLRSLCLIGKCGGSLDLEAVGPLAKEQLGSSNPRLREYGVRLLLQSIEERNVLCNRDLKETRAVYLENMQRSRMEGDSLMHTLLEYTRDPYPNVRQAVVRAILNLHSKGFALNHNTYKFAVSLLRDSFESVRICAIKLVGIWVKAAAWDVQEEPQLKYVDNAFMQICNMMTDMTMSVRQEACNVLAEMTGVSDNVLLQSLTKKILTSVTEKGSTAGGSSSTSNGDLEVAIFDQFKLFDWSVAGAFVVGLEDEFWEVRSGAVKALAKLGISSEKMANGALELIVDMINDDSSHVRQEAIEALTNLALAGRLSVLEAHLHMFIGILEDSKVAIRKAGHNLLSVISLHSIATFQLTVRAILTSLDKHPEDEDSISITLEKLGRSHCGHTESMINELVQELRGLLDGDSGLDSPRFVAILVLLLGAATGNGKIISLIPSRIMSVASFISNKLPISLPRLQVLPLGFNTNLYAWPTTNGKSSSENHNEYQSRYSRRQQTQVNGSQYLLENEIFESRGQEYSWQINTAKECFNQEETITTVAESEGNQGGAWYASMENPYNKTLLNQHAEREIRESTQRIVASALSTSLLLNMKAFKEVLQRLRGCRKELRALKGRCFGLSGMVSFCGLYFECLILVVELRAIFSSQESHALVKMSGLPQDLLNKLNSLLKHILHRFLGFSYEQLLQILELHAIMYIWTLELHPIDQVLKDGIGCTPILELESTVATAEKLTRTRELPPSLLLKSVREQLLNHEGKTNLNLCKTARQLALSYWPSLISFDSSVTEMWAVMKAPGSDFDQPLGFVPGLPLGIPIDVTVYNVPDMYSLWIEFVQEASAPGYKLLDVEDSDMNLSSNIRQLSTLLQLDEMPSVASSLCRLCIVTEGDDHQRNLEPVGRRKGPQGCIVPICTEMEVHLYRIRERGSKQLPHGKR